MNDGFQNRLSRLGDASAETAPEAQADINTRLNRNSVVFGFICSAVVILLFMNIQNISDMAPQSVKEGSMPGLWGMPIAILTIAWFAVIPIWFVVSFVVRLARAMRPIIGPFVLGAFVGMCLGLVAINLMPGPL